MVSPAAAMLLLSPHGQKRCRRYSRCRSTAIAGRSLETFLQVLATFWALIDMLLLAVVVSMC